MATDRLINYINGESIATGLVRPKTTAIFFDKIWIPRDCRDTEYGESFGYANIPVEVCILEEIADQDVIHRIIHFKESKSKPKTLTISESPFDYFRYILPNHPFYSVGKNYDDIHFLFSKSRNEGLTHIVTLFKKIYNIEVVPIYFDHTAFEDSVLSYDEKKYEIQVYRNFGIKLDQLLDQSQIETIRKQIRHLNLDNKEHSAYEICISNLPIAVEKNLEWKQVLELRKDTNSIKKIRRFKSWVDLELDGKSPELVKESLEIALEDYKQSLKKHGIITMLGCITTILSSSASAIGAISGDLTSHVATGLTITSGLLTFTASQLSEFFEKKREPIALIYDLEDKYSKNI